MPDEPLPATEMKLPQKPAAASHKPASASEYQIVSGWDEKEVEPQVRMLMRAGWRLQGGVATMWDSERLRVGFSQALVR